MAKNSTLFTRVLQHPAGRYVVAVLVTAVALVLAQVLASLFGDALPYAAVFPAIAFAAWCCGVGPTILAVVVAVAAVKYWFLPPIHTIGIVTARQALDIIVLVLASGIIAALGELRRRENHALRCAQGELEERVRQRTVQLDIANQGLRELTARLMQLQDDERRRIARELHDSVGQTLAALSMNLTAIEGDIKRLNQTAKTLADSSALVQEMNKEVRTISHLLHPPLLDEAGLVSALRWYTDGFTQRSQIAVELEIAEDFGRLSRELETGLFRTVQECLTNIHRHSGSPTARICLTRFDHEVRLQIKDQGVGISGEKLEQMASSATPGVGIRGMRERLRQLGGSLEIDCDRGGTVVEARLPLAIPEHAAA
jgi:signal transduction histidine kinase